MSSLPTVTHFEVLHGITEVGGQEKAIEVWLKIHIEGVEIPIAIRFQEPSSLDRLTDTLRQQRAFVFGRRWDEPCCELFDEYPSSEEDN
jgi:hypothetical protein